MIRITYELNLNVNRKLYNLLVKPLCNEFALPNIIFVSPVSCRRSLRLRGKLIFPVGSCPFNKCCGVLLNTLRNGPTDWPLKSLAHSIYGALPLFVFNCAESA